MFLKENYFKKFNILRKYCQKCIKILMDTKLFGTFVCFRTLQDFFLEKKLHYSAAGEGSPPPITCSLITGQHKTRNFNGNNAVFWSSHFENCPTQVCHHHLSSFSIFFWRGGGLSQNNLVDWLVHISSEETTIKRVQTLR